MKKIFLAFLILFSVSSVFAARKKAPTPQTSMRLQEKAPAKIRPLFHLSLDGRFERNEAQEIKPKTNLNLAGGVLLLQRWMVEMEYARFSESTGNASLSVDRQTEHLMAWGYWVSQDHNLLAPYIGVGAGGLREKVTTRLMGMSEDDQSDWSLTTGGAFGVRLLPKSSFWSSIEGRLYKNPRMDPDPQLGALIRIGYLF